MVVFYMCFHATVVCFEIFLLLFLMGGGGGGGISFSLRREIYI